MWFKLEPCELEFAERSVHRFRNEGLINAPPERVFGLLASDAWPEWYPDFLSVKWVTPGPHGQGSTREVKLKTLSARERFVAWEPGKRISFSIDEVTLPLIRKMMEDVRLDPAAEGKTRVVWDIHYEPRTVMRLIHPIARAIFGRMFRQAVLNLGRYVDRAS